MARKRLSNLNSEEAKKSPDPKSASTNPASVPEPSATSAEQDKAASAEQDKEESQAEKSQDSARPQPATGKAASSAKAANPVEVVDPTEITDPVKTAAPVEVASSVPADAATNEALEATIAELNQTKATLEKVCQTARDREAEFRAQVEQLQTDLQAKQTEIEQLQTDLQAKQAEIEQLETNLKQSSQLKSELEDARKMILQLSQMNAQPAPSPSIQSAKPKPGSSPSKQVRSQPQSPQPQPSEPPTPKRDDRFLSPIALQRQSPHLMRRDPFAISPEVSSDKLPEQDSRLSDSDMGWVD